MRLPVEPLAETYTKRIDHTIGKPNEHTRPAVNIYCIAPEDADGIQKAIVM
jgi:hypothetical protein